MVKYEICFGNYGREIVEVEEETTDYGALIDLMIDSMESKEETGDFIEWEQTRESGNEDGYFEDEYITGGNHGLILYHGGNLYINKL